MWKRQNRAFTIRFAHHHALFEHASNHNASLSVCVCVCVCSRGLGGWLANSSALRAKNKHCFISNIWNCYPPNPYSFGARSSIRTIIAQSLPLPPSFPASDGQRKAGARGMEGINNCSADATPCRMVPIMGAQRRGTAEAPLVGPSDLAARLSHGRPTPSSAQAKHPPWGSNPRPQG